MFPPKSSHLGQTQCPVPGLLPKEPNVRTSNLLWPATSDPSKSRARARQTWQRYGVILAGMIMAAGACVPASAGRYGYTAFLTNGVTMRPDGAGTFFTWHGRIDGDTVVFTAFLNSQSESIWRWRYGVFTKLVSTATPIPGGGGTFAQFDASAFVQPPVLRNGTVLFRAIDADGDPGFYTVPIGAGAVSRIADTSTMIPGTATPFDTLRDDQFGTDGTFVVFSGGNSSANVAGVYKLAANGSGALTVTADSTGPVNSDACAFPVNSFGLPAIDADHVVSYGQTLLDPSTGFNALYADVVDGFTTACNDPSFPGPYPNNANADQGLPGDASPTSHLRISAPLVAGNTVLFVARNGNSFGGLYSVPFGDAGAGGGPLTTLVDSTTNLPGTSPFDVVQDTLTFAVNGSQIFFDIGSRGVFRWNDGTINAVLVEGEVLNGRTISAVTLGDVNGFFSEEAHPNTASVDERVVLWVDFAGGGSSFYLASEPIFSNGFDR